MKPLFIPLKKQYFEEFLSGKKTTEYRRYGARWNVKTCLINRLVTLSCGYGKQRRLSGIIVGFKIVKSADTLSLPGFTDCYGEEGGHAAAIQIKVLKKLEAGQ